MTGKILVPTPVYMFGHPEYSELVFARSLTPYDASKAGQVVWHFELHDLSRNVVLYVYPEEFHYWNFIRVNRLRVLPEFVSRNDLTVMAVPTMYDMKGNVFFAAIPVIAVGGEILPIVTIVHPTKSYSEATAERGFGRKEIISNRVRHRNNKTSAPPRPNVESKVTSFPGHAESLNNSLVFTEEDIVLTRTTDYREYSGVRTPNFTKRAKAGDLPVNSHHMLSYKESDGWLNYFSSGNGTNQPPPYIAYSFEVCHLTKYYGIPALPQHVADADRRALQKLIDKASGVKANLAQDIAQFRQTTNLIADSARRIASALNSTRKGDFAQAIQTLVSPGSGRKTTSKRGAYTGYGGKPSHTKDLASNWLALQYGWKPLLQDIHETIALVREKSRTDVVRIRSTSKRAIRDESAFDTVGHPGFHAGIQGSNGFSQCNYGLRFKVNSQLTSYLAQTGFTNPVNLFWEILPYSFVVDWFLPIGPYLETISAWDGLDFVGGYQTRFTKTTDFCHVSFDDHYPGTFIRAKGAGAWSRNVVRLDRAPLSQFPSQKIPSFKNPVSVTHALNAMALMVVGFKKGSKLRD